MELTTQKTILQETIINSLRFRDNLFPSTESLIKRNLDFILDQEIADFFEYCDETGLKHDRFYELIETYQTHAGVKLVEEGNVGTTLVYFDKQGSTQEIYVPDWVDSMFSRIFFESFESMSFGLETIAVH